MPITPRDPFFEESSPWMEMGTDLDLQPRPVPVIIGLIEVDLAAHILIDRALDLAAFQVDAEIQWRDRPLHPDLIIGGEDDIFNPERLVHGQSGHPESGETI
jgi:hypothetical protein